MEPTRELIDALDACEIDYMLVGSYSSNYYGVARATKDADIVLHLGKGQIELLQDCLDVAAVQGEALDWDYMRGWCGKHGTLELLEEIREETRGI